ncbi:MAG: hypothetical protein H6805_09330 [Planctomycetes bacterium]|nr:hypothetical protein [Planctomycetota bacterium]
MRWASSLVTACGLLLAVLVAAAAPARAGSTMVVVDGAAAREDETLRDQARRLTQALVAAGDDVRVVVVAWRAGRVDVAHDEDGTAFGAREAWAVAEDAVPLDVREVFRVALERHRALKPLRLITLGPFEDDDDVSDPGRLSALGLATNRWNGTAPLKSRLLTPGLSERGVSRLTADGAPTPEGWMRDGWIVLGTGAPRAEVTPWSPLAPSPVRRAVVRAPLDVLRLGSPPSFALRVDVEGGRVWDGELHAGPPLVVAIGADAGSSSVTVSFVRVDAERDAWLASAPEPLVVTWPLAPDGRLVSAEREAPQPFAARHVKVGAPVEASWQLERTAVGGARWRLDPASRVGLPDTLDIELGDEAPLPGQPDVLATPLTVRFAARPGVAVDTQGELVFVVGDGSVTARLPVSVEVVPDVLALRAPGGELRFDVPAAQADAPLVVRLEAAGPNAPTTATLVTTSQPASLLEALAFDVTLPAATVRWNGRQPLDVPAGVEVSVRAVVREGARPEDLLDGTLTLQPAEAAFVEGRLDVAIHVRRPRWVREGEGPVRYDVVDGALRPVTPLAVRLEDEGVDGAWRAAWLDAPPTASWPGEALPLALAPDGPGRHVLAAKGPWAGDDAKVFDDVALSREVVVTDRVGREVVRVPVEVRVVARWGSRGWLLVILAALALVLGAVILAALRPPPVKGTLLYAVEGLGGTVGRLDLAPVRRGRREVRADAKGRLSLDGPGKAISVIRAERVGGVALVPTSGGEERRLLVDGLTWQSGRHRLRYVSGREADAPLPTADELPDLLGREFEMDTGRVQEAWDEAGGDDV